MPGYLILLFTCLLFNQVFSQKQIAEIELSSPGIRNLVGISCGDSLLLTYYENDFNKTRSANFRAVWIYPDGSQRRMDAKQLADKLLIAVVHTKDSIQYYFLEESKKKIKVGMLAYHRYTHQGGVRASRITLPGKVLGYYVEKNLFLIYATKEESAVNILEINDLTIVRHQLFSNSFDWKKLQDRRATFIDGRLPMRNSQIITPLRVIKEGSAIFVVADEPATTETQSQPSFKTYISKLDLKTNSSASKVFFEPSKADFRTVVRDNTIFRFVPRKDPELSIYDFETRSLLMKRVFEQKEKREYHIRSGIKNEVRRVELDRWSPLNSLISVDASPSGYILTLGGYSEENPNVPFLGTFGLLPAAISALANVAAHELNDGSMSYSYFYLETKKDFSASEIIPDTGLLKQQIDNYELSLTSQMAYKAYIEKPACTYAFYLPGGSLKMQVMKFERKN